MENTEKTPSAVWREVTQRAGAPTARSSHSVAVIGKKAYVFGGEFEPRVPIDNTMHVFDIDARTWSIMHAEGDAPLPRVGVTMGAIGSIIYVFGGRDAQHEELNELYSFNTETGQWALLSSGDSSPPSRSYHAFAVDEESRCIYTFGGCGKSGRLNDLWVYSLDSGKWRALPSPPPESTCVPRGGPGFVVVNNYVWVFYGFCGHELADIHRFDLEKNIWEEVSVSGDKPSARSVFGIAAVGKYVLLYGGEVDPSDLGHLGAGAFSGDAFLFDTENLSWNKLQVEVEEGKHPGERGWFPTASVGNSMLVYGGISESNDRLDDMFLISIKV